MKKSIAIVCDGTEIAFGMNLLHLIKYEEEDKSAKCKKYKDCNAEIYTIKVFERSKKISDVLKIYIGKAGKIEGSPIVTKYGISIWKSDESIFCVADASKISKKDYADFLKYANGLRDKYIEAEKEYFHSVNDLNSKWIVQEYKAVSYDGLFGRNSKQKAKLQQLYDCAALMLYTDILSY